MREKEYLTALLSAAAGKLPRGPAVHGPAEGQGQGSLPCLAALPDRWTLQAQKCPQQRYKSTENASTPLPLVCHPCPANTHWGRHPQRGTARQQLHPDISQSSCFIQGLSPSKALSCTKPPRVSLLSHNSGCSAPAKTTKDCSFPTSFPADPLKSTLSRCLQFESLTSCHYSFV